LGVLLSGRKQDHCGIESQYAFNAEQATNLERYATTPEHCGFWAVKLFTTPTR
jgi:hypothetical protein